LREPNEHLKIWEGDKLSKDEAIALSGVKNVKWLSELRTVLHQLMCESEHVYLNTNEHKRAVVEVETRDFRFIRDCRERYPLHDYCRLAPLMHELRVAKSEIEADLLRKACGITRDAFLRVLKCVKPGICENEIEAEFAHEFLRKKGRFAFSPIIASGASSCALHYLRNDQVCRNGDVLLLDVGASYANYNADMTRTIPVNGRFTRRQKQVYNAVLRVQQGVIRASVPGKLHRDWQKEAEALMQEELVKLGLITLKDIKKQSEDKPALKKYFMHGIGHPLGLDVHDLGLMNRPFEVNWVLTVEPGIYIPEEGFGIRLESDILIGEKGPIDLMADIPVEADEIEQLMAEK
jgi:Xaa-Pro aminopeptidase